MTLLSDIQELRVELHRLQAGLETEKTIVSRHEEQISGGRGLSAAIAKLDEDITSLKRTIWQVGAGIVSASIVFALSVLTVFGQ